MSDASLQAFNAEQRGAVEHGVAGSGTNVAAPLLFIARHGRHLMNLVRHERGLSERPSIGVS